MTTTPPEPRRYDDAEIRRLLDSVEPIYNAQAEAIIEELLAENIQLRRDLAAARNEVETADVKLYVLESRLANNGDDPNVTDDDIEAAKMVYFRVTPTGLKQIFPPQPEHPAAGTDSKFEAAED